MTHRTRRISLLTAVASLAWACSAVRGGVYHVYYLGGQSNMVGYGQVKELGEDDRAPVDGVMIYHGHIGNDGQAPTGKGSWATLAPGHGVGFPGRADRFGPELSFARRMKALHPDRNIAIIKYARGGTSIELSDQIPCWDPNDQRAGEGGVGINQYDHALATIDRAMRTRDIDGDGMVDILIPAGIVWMQGESDGMREEAARRYGANLGALMGRLRAALRDDELAVVIGRISDSHQRGDGGAVWPFGERIRAAQAGYCEADRNAALVISTDGYAYSDPYHYDSAGYTDLGARFAEAIHALETGVADD